MRLEPWEAQARCQSLTPQQADQMFFPTAGGKPNRANTFCGACPVESFCTERSVQSEVEGFWAGLTKEDRRKMREGIAAPVAQFAVPPEPPTRRIYRKIVVTEDVHSWLDTDLEPSILDLM